MGVSTCLTGTDFPIPLSFGSSLPYKIWLFGRRLEPHLSVRPHFCRISCLWIIPPQTAHSFLCGGERQGEWRGGGAIAALLRSTRFADTASTLFVCLYRLVGTDVTAKAARLLSDSHSTRYIEHIHSKMQSVACTWSSRLYSWAGFRICWENPRGDMRITKSEQRASTNTSIRTTFQPSILSSIGPALSWRVDCIGIILTTSALAFSDDG